MANERLRMQVQNTVAPGQPVPFLCECLDDLCIERIDMTLGDYLQVRASDDTFAVAPGHAAPRGEVVVAKQGAFHVVRKDTV